MTYWTPGDVSGSQTLTDNDHSYPDHLNELRTAVESLGENIKNYGAVGDGVTDDTAAIQAALHTKKKVWIPSGTYKTTAALYAEGYEQVIEGEGSQSRIKPVGAIHGFTDNPDAAVLYNRVFMKNFSIQGDTSTLDAIHFDKMTYMSSFENLFLTAGQIPFHNTEGFSYALRNCHLSSYNNHGLEIEGGPSVLIDNCYVHFTGTDKVGYKVWGSATLLSCNGVDGGANIWGEFGATSADEGSNAQFKVNLIGCNFESWTKEALHFKYNGQANINGCTFQSPATDYDCLIWIDYCDAGIVLNNNFYYSGAGTMAKLAEIYTPATAYVMTIIGVGDKIDVGGVLKDCPNFQLNNLQQVVATSLV